MSFDSNIDKSAIKIVKIDQAGSDFTYWQTRSIEERLYTLETIRNEYIAWAYDTEPRFQRVYRIIKQK